jgi:hypothetical protein
VASVGMPNGGSWQFIKGWAALVLPGTWAPRLACLGFILFAVSAGIPSQYEEVLIVPAAVLLLGASVLTAYRIDIVYRDEPSGIGARFRQLFGLFRCIYGIAVEDEDGPEGYVEPDDKAAIFITSVLVVLFLSFVTGVLVSLVAANSQYFPAAFHTQYLGLVGRSETVIVGATLWFLIGVPNQAYKVFLGKNAGHALLSFVTVVSCMLTAIYLFLLHFGVGPLSKVQRGPLVVGIVFTVALVAPVYRSLASGVLNPEVSDERWSKLATEVRTALARPARRQASEGEPSPPPPVQQPAPPQATVGHGYTPQSAAARVTSGLAIASLILSILWLGGLGSLLAIIFGVMALWQIRQSSGKKQGAGLATAGLVIGSVGLLGMALLYTLTTTPTKITTADFTFQLPANWNANTAVTEEGGFYIVANAHPDGLSGNIRVASSIQAGWGALNSLARFSTAMPKILKLPGEQVSLVAGPTAASLDHAPAVEFQYDAIRGHKEFFGEEVWAVHSGYLYILQMITDAGDNQVPAAFQMELKTWIWR